jgi:hypothetical protein
MARDHYHPPISINGILHDLAHLAPFLFEANSAKIQRPLRINVRFTNHCYSEAFHPDIHAPDALVIRDGVRRRTFCLDRYNLSHRLPGLIRNLANPNARVHQTASRRNWMYAAIVEVPVPTTRYQIFFELRRTVQERRHLQDLDMVVESAYPAASGRPEPNILGRVNFLLLAGSLYAGKHVTTRR